jgi:endonuclease-3
MKAEVKKITLLLEKEYGIPQKEKGVDPLDTLIQTILSQNTNDLNRDRAFQRLKNRYPQWEDVLSAKRAALIATIRTGGLAKQKARRIQEILRWIEKREGRLSLSFLKGMDSEEIKKLIGGLKGVGPKTVHCLLLFGLGRDAFPVDTHILRIGKRIGFIPKKIDAVKAHSWMIPLIPKGKSLSLHLNLIQFGRSICKAIRPRCEECFLAEKCLYHSQ